MATGRTTENWMRVYADGYDLSGYTRSIGPLAQEFAATPVAAFSDAVKNVLVGQGKLSIGALNGFFDNTAVNGLHTVLAAGGTKRVVMIPIGIRAAPAQGDPALIGEFEQGAYKAVALDGYISVNLPFEDVSNQAAQLAYTKPWGWLLHAKGAETAVNTAVGIDDNGAASALGGYMCYQIFTANGTATVKVQDAATNSNGSFSDLSGATSGSVDASASPKSGIVALGVTATVRRYLRWQIVLGTATTVTFALAFVRG